MAARLTEQHLKKFVGSVTGFHEEEENFGLCLKFVASNLKYHNFLDVDAKKVQRALDGVCQKFTIHSEMRKSAKLQELSIAFLESPVFENKEKGHTDTHYALLSFLLNIAENPVKADYVETIQPVEEEVKDDFDWGAFLLEGIEVIHPNIADEDLSDWSDEDDDEGQETLHPVGTSNDMLVVAAGNQVDLPPGDHSGNEGRVTVTRVDEFGLEAITTEGPNDWLRRNLVVQYWTGEEDHFETGQKPSSNFHATWENYKSTSDPLHGNYKYAMVTEWKVMREVFWMLMGITDLYLFRYQNGKFTPRPDLAISSLSEEALHSLLSFFTHHGAQIVELEDFFQKSVAGSEDYCRTYQGFAQAVSEFYQNDLLKTLSALETKVFKQEETITLTRLYRELHPLMQRVEIVYGVYERGILKGQQLKSHSQKASHLLTVLYETLMTFDTLFECNEVIEHKSPYFEPIMAEPYDNTFRNTSADLLQLLLPVWLMTSEPYISIISTWISDGSLDDHKQEFVIHRNKNIETLEQTFWEKSFAVHTMKTNQGEAPNEERHDGKEGYETSDWAPEFLKPVLQQVVLTGKSMEMLESLGALAKHEESISEEVVFTKEGGLFEKFLKSLEDLLATPKEPTPEPNHSKEGAVFAPDIEPYLNVRGTYCPLLKMYFEQLMSNSCTLEEKKLEQLMERINTEELQPIQLILQDCLYPHIHLQYQRVCSKLVHTLKTEYRLTEYLSAMRNFFLMEAGDTMFPFYTVIFDKIRNHERWRDISMVTWSLQEALDLHFPDEVTRLTVSLETMDRNTPCQPINVTDCIKLCYQVPCPVDSVISERCQTVYNQIFQFLLQVKRAKYCLDELRFCDLSSDYTSHSLTDEDMISSQAEDSIVPRSAKLHRMHLLKMKFTYFVNSFHNYIMTRILHSIGIEFTRDLQTATDLDQIIAIHAAYIRKIHQRCLLNQKAAFLKEAIMKVLNLVLTFQVKWDQGINQLSMKTLDSIEKEFSRCVHFLSSFLNNVVQRKTFPHLESLALCLQDLHMPSRH